MPFRETLLNLAITAVLVLIVVLAGILLKESRPGPPAAIPVRATDRPAEDGMTGRTAAVQFEVFPRPVFIESRANEADTLRIRVRDEEHIFVLYFVDALEASMNHPQVVAEQGRFFHRAADKTITETGAEAAAYVSELLQNHPFHVLTRWEQVANTGRFYAIIVVETAPGKREYLANLLMQQGYARRGAMTTELPGGTPSVPEYFEQLKRLGMEAEQQKRGIWAKIAK